MDLLIVWQLGLIVVALCMIGVTLQRICRVLEKKDE